jgi:hypothetical protein
VLLRSALWIPPALLVALLVAGPVAASSGTPAAAHPAAAPVAGKPPTLRPQNQDPSSCPVVIAALSATGTPVGPATCLAPATRSASPTGAGVDAGAGSNTQVVSQSIGLEVRPG